MFRSKSSSLMQFYPSVSDNNPLHGVPFLVVSQTKTSLLRCLLSHCFVLRISPTVCLFITGLNILVSLYHHALLRSFLVKFVVIPRPVSPPCLLRFYSHPHITRSVNKSARSAPHFVCTAASKRISPLPRFSIISAFFQKASDFFPPFPSFLWHPQRDNLSPSFLILSVSEGCV